MLFKKDLAWVLMLQEHDFYLSYDIKITLNLVSAVKTL